MQTEVVILGQGLAGSSLAWRLAERAIQSVVIDRGGVDSRGARCASRVAGGLVTPVMGKRMTVAEGFDAIYLSSLSFYRDIEAKTGAKLLDQTPSLRIFKSAEEREQFLGRSLDSHAALASNEELTEFGLPAAYGGFSAPGSLRLNTDRYLDATEQWLSSRGQIIRASLDPNTDLAPAETGVAIEPLGIQARLVVLCQGHTAIPIRWLDGVDFAPAKGEVLTIRTSQLTTDRVVRRGVWIAPCESGASGQYRVGSTTERNEVGSGPTAAGREELLGKLREMGLDDFEIIGHEAGVRPATPSRQPALGFCESAPRIAWFNGLGAKGTLWAPYYAEKMANRVVNSLS